MATTLASRLIHIVVSSYDVVTFPGIVTVFVAGDEIAFGSIEEAKAFIDWRVENFMLE